MLCQYYSCLKSSKYKIFGRMKYQAQMRGPGNDAAASSLFAACATGSMIGEETGFTGMLLASLIGAITLIPVMIAFPIVAELFKKRRRTYTNGGICFRTYYGWDHHNPGRGKISGQENSHSPECTCVSILFYHCLLNGGFSQMKTAVPLYALLPVAGVLLKKGCRVSNVLIFLCASASIRIPLLFFEISSLGAPFTLISHIQRLFIDINRLL